jgi:hypothetical protein
MSRTALFEDVQTYVPLKESLLGLVPMSVIDPWVVPELRAREKALRLLVGDDGQSRAGVLGGKKGSVYTNEVSIFSPVFAEILLKVYGPKEPGLVLDPFAGGGTRAVISTLNGHQYRGIELRPEEAERVRSVLTRLGLAHLCKVEVGDSTRPHTGGGPFDFLLTCPPYWHLERYGGGPADLSEVSSYESYLDGLSSVLTWTRASLKPGTLAVWVVGNYLENDEYVDIRADLSVCARNTGWAIHDCPVLKQKVGTAGLRVGTQVSTRRLVRIHEYALVLRKRD